MCVGGGDGREGEGPPQTQTDPNLNSAPATYPLCGLTQTPDSAEPVSSGIKRGAEPSTSQVPNSGQSLPF